METFGYKFSDSVVLNYQCIIELCKKSTGECRGLTPPACGRVRRSVQTTQIRKANTEGQLEVSTSLTMMQNRAENPSTPIIASDDSSKVVSFAACNV